MKNMLKVRAASIAHCGGPWSAAIKDDGAWTRIRGQHSVCVQGRATRSVMAIMGVQKENAMDSVKAVFTRCYNDTEPVGRFRCRVP